MYYDGLYYNLEAASTILDKKTTLSEWGIMSLMGISLYIVRSLPVDSLIPL